MFMMVIICITNKFSPDWASEWQGADLIAGSLIKNPGGTIAPCGGYVAGKKDLVAAAAARLSAPGLGVEFGSAPGHVMRALFQGLFLAPQMVGEAVKVGLLINYFLF
jgi:cystathionine beta-lyase family protein involved in aluminum resistance